jgi:hypothetical protein
MAFIRNSILFAAAFSLWGSFALAQTIYYPSGSSPLMKSTASDVAMLFQKAIAGSHFSTQEYITQPSSGILLIYDTTFSENGSCRVQGNGSNLLKFTAAQDNGLNFGIYHYLQQAGFRFYQPGSIWEIIPVLASPFKAIDTVYSVGYKYMNWFISGGHNRWVMDNNPDYGWDTYYGEEGHNWALYQRRNGMTGAYRFTGHRGDIMTGSYLSALQNNPCYVACFNGSRTAGAQSVPDINNAAAMPLWGSSIGQQYTQFRNTIYSNPGLYANYYRNFNYYYGNIGIEVPDGAHWGNSTDNSGCGTGIYPDESSQNFTLANYTVQKLGPFYPGKRFQLYAYYDHANTPPFSVDPSIDVQVIPGAFQSESSPKGLLGRWYNKTKNISEYQYLNIPQWGGETPMFYLNDLKSSLQRARDNKSQGVVWEASPAKFASLPFLLAATHEMNDKVPVDSTLRQFCDDMFAGASNTLYGLLQMWSDDKTVSFGNFMTDNKYKIPLYLQKLNDAVDQTQNAAPVVKERISELKAYLHYMILYYDWLFDQRSNDAKREKAAALCLYLARIDKLQLVNSYFLIADITSRYTVTDDFYTKYNVQNGSAYLNGNLQAITTDQIEENFQHDLAVTGGLVQQYQLQSESYIRSRFSGSNLKPLKKIKVNIGYTNGANYPNRSEFYIDAPAAGTFTVEYTPHFNMPGKGYINFTVEDAGQALKIIKDFSIGKEAAPGMLNITLPSAGLYKFSVVSKYQSAVDLSITTNGNYFYRNGPFLGTKTENYRNDLSSLPGYFYVPSGVDKLYFSINNSNAGGAGYASAESISKTFLIKDNRGNAQQLHFATDSDSALFYLDVPAGSGNAFWQAGKMEQYNLCFANISNLQWYAEQGTCTPVNFTVSVVRKKGECITELSTADRVTAVNWEINDLGKTTHYQNTPLVDLPFNPTPEALVTITNEGGCTISKRLGDDKNYLKALQDCSGGTSAAAAGVKTVVYPNPSHGLYRCLQNGLAVTADRVIVTDAQGLGVGVFMKVQQFDISNVPGGIYWYKMEIKGSIFTGRLIKL